MFFLKKKLLIISLLSSVLLIGILTLFFINQNQNNGVTFPKQNNQTILSNNGLCPGVTNPNFQGIIQFSGNQDTQNASIPYLAGADITAYWSEIEPIQGQYHWDVIDSRMKPWIANNKKVVLRLMTAGWTKWSPPYSKEGTPSWLFALGVPSVKEIDGSILPQYWNSTYLSNLQQLIQAFATRYDGNPNVLFVEVGIGSGGETLPDSQRNPSRLALWQAIGYTNAVYWKAVMNIINIYKDSFHVTPLAVMPDSTFLEKEKGYTEQLVLDYVKANNLWLQDNGLKPHRRLSPIWNMIPHSAEQRNTTSVSGDTIQDDLCTALKQGANYILIYSRDISNPSYQNAFSAASVYAHLK